MTRAAKGRRAWAAVLGLAAVLLAAALPAPASASAPSPTYAETRVWGFEVQNPAGVGAERALSPTRIEAYAARYDEPAAGYPLVPRGGAGAESAFQAERLKASLSAQELSTAPRVGSALKADPFHRAGSFVVDDVAQSGRVFPLRGADGVQRTLTQVEGAVNGQSGVFEWIVDPSGAVTHQRFIPGGRITGVANQVP